MCITYNIHKCEIIFKEKKSSFKANIGQTNPRKLFLGLVTAIYAQVALSKFVYKLKYFRMFSLFAVQYKNLNFPPFIICQ